MTYDMQENMGQGPFLKLQFLGGLQLEIINLLMWDILKWHVFNSFNI